MNAIRPLRMQYRDTWFASTLEADWAATFDHLGWYWQYEPMAVKLPDGTAYRPDFYLPSQRVWCEVKGPHNERIAKPEQLQAALGYDAWEPVLTLADRVEPLLGTGGLDGESAARLLNAYMEYAAAELVVVLRPPGPGEAAEWNGTLDYQNIAIVLCPDCQHYGFIDHNGPWQCRRHPSTGTRKFWQEDGGSLFFTGEMMFTRAPRPARRAA